MSSSRVRPAVTPPAAALDEIAAILTRRAPELQATVGVDADGRNCVIVTCDGWMVHCTPNRDGWTVWSAHLQAPAPGGPVYTLGTNVLAETRDAEAIAAGLLESFAMWREAARSGRLMHHQAFSLAVEVAEAINAIAPGLHAGSGGAGRVALEFDGCTAWFVAPATVATWRAAEVYRDESRQPLGGPIVTDAPVTEMNPRLVAQAIVRALEAWRHGEQSAAAPVLSPVLSTDLVDSEDLTDTEVDAAAMPWDIEGRDAAFPKRRDAKVRRAARSLRQVIDQIRQAVGEPVAVPPRARWHPLHWWRRQLAAKAAARWNACTPSTLEDLTKDYPPPRMPSWAAWIDDEAYWRAAALEGLTAVSSWLGPLIEGPSAYRHLGCNRAVGSLAMRLLALAAQRRGDARRELEGAVVLLQSLATPLAIGVVKSWPTAELDDAFARFGSDVAP